MSALTDFLRARIAEDDALAAALHGARPKPAWSRRFFFRICPESVQRHMARLHASHPDYRAEWKP